jgi:hypothetical protein
VNGDVINQKAAAQRQGTFRDPRPEPRPPESAPKARDWTWLRAAARSWRASVRRRWRCRSGRRAGARGAGKDPRFLASLRTCIGPAVELGGFSWALLGAKRGGGGGGEGPKTRPPQDVGAPERRAPSLGRRTSSLYFALLLPRRLAFLGVGRQRLALALAPVTDSVSP